MTACLRLQAGLRLPGAQSQTLAAARQTLLQRVFAHKIARGLVHGRVSRSLNVTICLQAGLRLSAAQGQALAAARQTLLQRVVEVRQQRAQLVMRLGAASLQQVHSPFVSA